MNVKIVLPSYTCLARGVHPARVTSVGTAAELIAWFLVLAVAFKLTHLSKPPTTLQTQRTHDDNPLSTCIY